MLQRCLCLQGILLVFAVDAVDALHCLLVARPHLHLPMRRLPLSILLARVKFHQFFFELGGFLFLVVSLLALFLLVATVDLFEVLLVDLGLLRVLLLQLPSSSLALLPRRSDLTFVGTALLCIRRLLPPEKRVLVFRLLNRVIYLVLALCMKKVVHSANLRTRTDLEVPSGNSWKFWSAA